MLDSLKYEVLIKQYKNVIYNYALYMLKNQMDADDIAQEVFIRIWKNIDNFNFKAAKSWIMKTTHNLCIDYLRKQSVAIKRETKLNSEMDNYNSNLTAMTDTEVKFRKNIIKERIKQGIDNLPDNLKSVFVLYELQGFKYYEISESLSMPLNTVKVYLMRARKKLQEDLKEFKNERLQ